ncbi:MAG: glycerol kinase GlpK [Oscillospiraceae bacterium]|nr:glycerol kinase GlpK [Oscillospiraceae bacterium]
MGKYIMSLDSGTTSNRCILFDSKGSVCSMAQKEFTQYFPYPGWVEHDAKEIFATLLGVAREAMARIDAAAEDIAAIGITNQRETTVLWDRRTGEPVAPAIVWQCRRTADYCRELEATPFASTVTEKTGLIIDAYFSATKIKWILDNVPHVRERAQKGDILFGTIDTWIMWNLTGGAVHATDYSNAARTMLYNIHDLCWDEEIISHLDIPMSVLPQVCPSGHVFGYTAPELLGQSIKIAGVAGDQQAALFGQTCFASGEAKNTYGTGCFLLMNTGTSPVKSQSGLVTTIAWGLDGQVTYALEGSVFVAGAAIQWLRDELGIIANAAQSQEFAEKVSGTNGCYFVPAFTGLGAPYWNQEARGVITGLTRGVNKYHLVRAALESLAYQTDDVLRPMLSDSGISLKSLKIDGGASANDFLAQFQADISAVPVDRPKCVETTALGAAYLAGLTVGFWRSLDEIRRNRVSDRVFVHSMSEDDRRQKLSCWNRAVRQCISGTDEI